MVRDLSERRVLNLKGVSTDQTLEWAEPLYLMKQPLLVLELELRHYHLTKKWWTDLEIREKGSKLLSRLALIEYLKENMRSRCLSCFIDECQRMSAKSHRLKKQKKSGFPCQNLRCSKQLMHRKFDRGATRHRIRIKKRV